MQHDLVNSDTVFISEKYKHTSIHTYTMPISIISSDSDVRWAMRAFLASEPQGMYGRWALERSRREFALLEAEMQAKPGDSLARNIWICSLGWAEERFTSAIFNDCWVANERKMFPAENKNDKYYFFFYTICPVEMARNEALTAAEAEYKRTGDQTAFDAAVMAIEETYYASK